MSNAQSYSLSQEANCLSGTGHASNSPDLPLQDLHPVHLRGRNDFPRLEDDYRPPGQTPEALDERLYDDLCRGV
jgi:hypothetical protein